MSSNKKNATHKSGSPSSAASKNKRPIPAPPARSGGQRLARGLFARTETPEVSKAEPVAKPLPKVAPAKDVPPTVRVMPVASEPKAPAQHAHGLNVPQLRESFAAQAPSRARWNEKDYVSLIRRLDALQTEAFILKGKLLAEAKDKFYAENRNGWIGFCESTLGMNYTTANQYIRVALECDVMSHQYPTLGFEHFKALLPVTPEQRPQLLAKFEGGSVKALRMLVSHSFSGSASGNMAEARTGALAKGGSAPREGAQKAARQLLRHLQAVHASIESLDMEALPQRLAWQVSVASGQVASLLVRTARMAALVQDINEADTASTIPTALTQR